MYMCVYMCVYMYTISFLFFNIKSKIISWIIISGQLDEIVFFLVAFGIAINLIFLLFIFVQTDCLCCVGNKYYYYYCFDSTLFFISQDLEAPPECKSTGSRCIRSCDGLPDGDYQSCNTCHGYVTCANGKTFDNRPCPSGLEWDDNENKCLASSSTCTCINVIQTVSANYLDYVCFLFILSFYPHLLSFLFLPAFFKFFLFDIYSLTSLFLPSLSRIYSI